MIPKSQDTETRLFQEYCSICITIFIVTMLSAVYLYNKFLFETDEIKYILLEWMLPSEFASIKLSPS